MFFHHLQSYASWISFNHSPSSLKEQMIKTYHGYHKVMTFSYILGVVSIYLVPISFIMAKYVPNPPLITLPVLSLSMMGVGLSTYWFNNARFKAEKLSKMEPHQSDLDDHHLGSLWEVSSIDERSEALNAIKQLPFYVYAIPKLILKT